MVATTAHTQLITMWLEYRVDHVRRTRRFYCMMIYEEESGHGSAPVPIIWSDLEIWIDSSESFLVATAALNTTQKGGRL